MRLIFVFMVSLLVNCKYEEVSSSLEENLVAYYNFDGNTLDLSPTKLDAVGYNIEFVDGGSTERSIVVFFNGIDANAVIPHSKLIDFSRTAPFAICFWVRCALQKDTLNKTTDFMCKWNDAGNTPYPFAIRLYNQMADFNKRGVIYGQVYDTDTVAYNYSQNYYLMDNNWHFIVFQRPDEGHVELYLDGKINHKISDPTKLEVTNTLPLFIGCRNDATQKKFNFFTGYMDDLRFYNRALDESEIAYLSKH